MNKETAMHSIIPLTSPAETKVVYSAANVGRMAQQDISNSLRRRDLWLGLARRDIRDRFRRSVLGPIWLILSNAVTIGAMALVFGGLFHHPLERFLPYISVGIVTWTLIANTLTEGCFAFIGAESYIKNIPAPISIHVYRAVARNIIVWAYGMLIYLVVAAIFMVSPQPETLLVVPGFLVLVANISWMCMIMAVLAARFRDVQQIVASVLQVVMVLTPIFWSPSDFPSRPVFIDINPFYHLIELIRAPLLGSAPAALSWVVSISLAIVGCAFSVMLFKIAYRRIPYWL
ncbi:ABC transporter permease [Mesorhizobium sp. M0053]|uniref:ABC transporter permease n=1 Tax=Mesorhizobium sp. M0053 TaxID=2956864 RepID=UPI00333A18C9